MVLINIKIITVFLESQKGRKHLIALTMMSLALILVINLNFHTDRYKACILSGTQVFPESTQNISHL